MSSRNAYQILKVHLTSLEETKNTSLTQISRFYYLQLPNVVDQLLEPLVLPLIYTSWRRLWDVALDQGVKGTRIMQAIFKELCRPSSCFQCSLYVTLWCPVIAHARNMLVQTTQVKWRTFHTIILFPFS